MTDDTDTGTELPVESLPLESVDRETARDSEHVLESTVEVFHEYEQRYDPEKDVILVGPTRTTVDILLRLKTQESRAVGVSGSQP
jgi:hypothetical protein